MVRRPDARARHRRDAALATISWAAVPGASSYRVYVSLDRAYTDLQEVIDTAALEWTPPAVLRTSPQGWAHADGEIRIRFTEPVTGVSDHTVTLSGAPATVTQLEPTLVSLKPNTVLRPGAGHRLRVSADVRDAAGNPLVAFDSPLVVGVDVDDASRVFSWAGPWSPSVSTQAFAGSFSRAVPDGRTHTAADFDFTGFGIELKGCKGPSNGVFEIWVDGVHHSRVDGYAPFSTCDATLATVNGLPWAAHHVQVRGIGAKHPASAGTVVGLDGIHVIR